MTSRATLLRDGRDAYERRSWREAREALSYAHAAEPLGPDDLWRLAQSSYLTGREDDFIRVLEEAHHARLEAGERLAAARCAFWLGFHQASRGEMARATGWFGRAGRLVGDDDCVERGYLILTESHRRLHTGEYEAGARAAAEAAALGERFGDADLLALALHVQGRALLRQSRVEEGLALLDEAMIGVSTDELIPQVTGLIYCSVISACREVYDLGRAREWTSALADWCASQPDMVAYAGECRVYRSEILQLRGQWRDALAEARRATELMRGRMDSVAGLALYQQGEVHRLRGEYEAAEEAYRAASRSGRAPQPGLALLRMAQGEGEAAVAAIRRGLAEARDPAQRGRLLPAGIEIMLAAGELEEARTACAELAEIAEEWGSGLLDVSVALARGAIDLTSGDPEEAVARLRSACRGWQALDARYEAARARVLLALACRALGDEEGAALELLAARVAFEELGAAPDLARVDALLAGPTPTREYGLTPREREVLGLVATGRTNRAIAKALFISEKTVARHVANVFGKLGVSSRSAATAFAYEHDLLVPPT